MRGRPAMVAALLSIVGALALVGPPLGRAAPDLAPLTWAVNASDAGGAVIGSSARHQLDPGGYVRGWVTISNFGTTPLVVEVGVQDGVTDETGTIVPACDGPVFRPSESVYQTPGTRVTVEPKGRATVPYDIALESAAAPGDRVLMFTASSVRADGTSTPGLDDRSVRIDLRVTGQLEPALTLTDLEPLYDAPVDPLSPGTVTIRYRMTNPGNLVVGGSILTALGTLYSQRIDSALDLADRIELVPGSEYVGEATIPAVWPLVRFDARAAFFPESISGAPIDVDGPGLIDSTVLWALPTTQLVAVAAVFVLVMVALVLRARRVRRPDSAETRTDSREPSG